MAIEIEIFGHMIRLHKVNLKVKFFSNMGLFYRFV